MTNIEDENVNLCAVRQVEAFLAVLSMRYNVKEDDIPRLLDTIRWAADHRTRVERASWLVASTLIVLALSGWAKSFWDWITGGRS